MLEEMLSSPSAGKNRSFPAKRKWDLFIDRTVRDEILLEPVTRRLMMIPMPPDRLADRRVIDVAATSLMSNIWSRVRDDGEFLGNLVQALLEHSEVRSLMMEPLTVELGREKTPGTLFSLLCELICVSLEAYVPECEDEVRRIDGILSSLMRLEHEPAMELFRAVEEGSRVGDAVREFFPCTAELVCTIGAASCPAGPADFQELSR